MDTTQNQHKAMADAFAKTPTRPYSESNHDEGTKVMEQATKILCDMFGRISTWPKPTGLNVYKSRESDVIITTYPKAGTTLLQNMAYEIVVHSGGESDDSTRSSSDITEIAPWVDYMPEFGLTPNETTPRLFKSHSSRNVFEAHGCVHQKHVIVIRDPLDIPASWMNFMFDSLTSGTVTDRHVREACFHLFTKSRLLGQTITGDVNTDPVVKKDGTWCEHTKSWVDVLQENILILFYEDVNTDRMKAIRTLARFMRCALSETDVREIADSCSRDAMAGDPRFKCGVEARTFDLGDSVWKVFEKDCKKCAEFKNIEIRGEDKEEVTRLMFLHFGFRTYQEMKEDVKRRQYEMFQR